MAASIMASHKHHQQEHHGSGAVNPRVTGHDASALLTR
jgi:hypothetical protein